jgi:hypothetical protein
MRPVTLAPVAAFAVACASQSATVTVTTRTHVELASGATPHQTITLAAAPGRLDALTIAAALDGHGRWEESVAYGRVWIPYEAIAGGFVPYFTHGEWVPARDGWYWQSGYAWGQIPFHYGRWVEIDQVWAWVPGSSFAPAWVEWRTGGSWVGWSPLAPEGADFAAPFVYCYGPRLAGSGLQARVVTGAAAVSLFAATSSLGGTAWPALPPVVALDVASLWGQPPPATALTATAIDLTSRPLAVPPPEAIEAIPSARVHVASRTAPNAASDGGRTVGVIRDGADGATLVLVGEQRRGAFGYSTVPARTELVAVRPPSSEPVVAARGQPAAVWDRSVATPPAAVDPSGGAAMVPGYVVWGRSRTVSAWTPFAQPPLLRTMGGGMSGTSALVPAPMPAAVPTGVTQMGGGPPSPVQNTSAGPLTLR